MARSLNTKGREELASLKRRVIRQESLERIHPSDAKKLIDKINELDALIIKTYEIDETKESYFSV